jgi:hypothetical protein
MAGSGGFGVVLLLGGASVLWSAVREGVDGLVGGSFVFLLLTAAAGFFLRIAGLALRGRNREICDLLSALATVAAFTALLILPAESMLRAVRNPAIERLFGLPMAVVVLFAPFLAFLGARWVNDRLRTTLHRFVHDDVARRSTSNRHAAAYSPDDAHNEGEPKSPVGEPR